MSLWATEMTTGMMLPVADDLDRAGFYGLEIVGSSFFKKCVRELRDDPWQRIRLMSGRMRTPLRLIRTRHIAAFQTTPDSIAELWMERLAANGIRQARMSDPSNTVQNLKGQVDLARKVGIDPIVNLIYTVSPRHTDDYYRQRAAELSALDIPRICLKDPGGLLTPERTRQLVQVLVSTVGSDRLEIHNHCNTGLGQASAVAAVEAGVRTVSTAIPPLADAASLPSIFRFRENLDALGYQLDIDEEPLLRVSVHLSRLAARDNRPIGGPAEYDSFHYRHQVPGGMISNFRSQLGRIGMGTRLREVLDEVAAVRADLGYPIMVTPYSQFVGTQAAMNVISGERYKEVSDEIICYALGQWGEEEAAVIDPQIKDRILSRSRAAQLATRRTAELSIADVREQLDAGVGVDDDELLLRYLTSEDDVVAMKRDPSALDDVVGENLLTALVRGLLGAGHQSLVCLEGDDLKISVRRSVETRAG